MGIELLSRRRFCWRRDRSETGIHAGGEIRRTASDEARDARIGREIGARHGLIN